MICYVAPVAVALPSARIEQSGEFVVGHDWYKLVRCVRLAELLHGMTVDLLALEEVVGAVEAERLSIIQVMNHSTCLRPTSVGSSAASLSSSAGMSIFARNAGKLWAAQEVDELCDCELVVVAGRVRAVRSAQAAVPLLDVGTPGVVHGPGQTLVGQIRRYEESLQSRCHRALC